MKNYLYVMVCALIATTAFARETTPPGTDGAAGAVAAELEREAAAWNRGDLDGYLSGYERAASTIMVGKNQLYRGWDAIAAMYRSHYGDRARMGRLAFSGLEVRILSSEYAFAAGRWSLARDEKAGGPAGGFFTLTLHKSGSGWRIVVDHTS